MTQLVQLQHALPMLQDAGFDVYAISNDTVERLAAFADEHAITFDLLSDENSDVIRAFGIMNQLIRPDEGKHMRWYGIPYPGTYIADTAGIIIDKDFHQHHARRLSGPALLQRLGGVTPEPDDNTPIALCEGDEVSLTVNMVDPTLKLEVISLLVCRIRIATGRHIYAPGAPQAFTPVRLELDGDGVRFGEPVWPQPNELTMTELNMTAPVFEGDVEVTVPVSATSALIRLGHGLEQDTAKIAVTCTYQSCDELSCGLPTSLTSTLVVPLEALVEPPGIKTYAERIAQQQAAPSEHTGG